MCLFLAESFSVLVFTRLLGFVTTWAMDRTLTFGSLLSGFSLQKRLEEKIQFEIRHQKPTFDWEHEESSFKMLLLAMEENPEIKMTKEELDFVRELICGGDKEKERKGEYPYSARGPDKFYLYEIIANKVTTKGSIFKYDGYPNR